MKTIKFIIILVAVGILVNCNNAPQKSEEEIIKEILKDIMLNYSNLVDPDSVKFRKTHVEVSPLLRDNGIIDKYAEVCGELNSKNSMGGYVGWLKYIVKYNPNIEQEKYSVYIEKTSFWDIGEIFYQGCIKESNAL